MGLTSNKSVYLTSAAETFPLATDELKKPLLCAENGRIVEGESSAVAGEEP
jgi:hypothetical protein